MITIMLFQHQLSLFPKLTSESANVLYMYTCMCNSARSLPNWPDESTLMAETPQRENCDEATIDDDDDEDEAM